MGSEKRGDDTRASEPMSCQLLSSGVLGKVPVTGQKRGSGRISGDVPQRDFEPSRPAADATREVVERWLLDDLM
jgi:hypothetical protein